MFQFVRSLFTALIALCLCGSSVLAGPAPAWFAEHIADLTQDGGVWITDNSAYQSENEPSDSYGLEWQYGAGDKSAFGRLYGIVGGEDTGTIWEFRMYWHPGLDQALLLQFGAGGALLNGPLTIKDDGSEQLQQTFYLPDGRQFETGHRTSHPQPGVQVGGSYDIDEDGNWTEKRSYTWHRQAPPES